MNDSLGTPTTGALFFTYANALTSRPFGRGFGLIDDDIHALAEHALQVNQNSDANGVARQATTCG